jgi:predicted dehydrogenase
MAQGCSRRAFLVQASALSAASVAGRSATAANEILSAAVLGCGIRGQVHADVLADRQDCRVRWVCDPDRGRAEKLADRVEKRQAERPRIATDLRSVLDDAALDVVSIATPNHWHALAAIWAMQAGKDVYVEKPVSHSIEEGRRLVQVARRHNRICQAGTQARSLAFLPETRAFLAAGGIGPVRLARAVYLRQRKPIGGPGWFQPPAGVDYGLFCGPAPLDPLTRPQFHYDWHWFWSTGDGELGNNGIHMLDVIRLLLGLEGPGEATISFGTRAGYHDAAETPHTQTSITLFPKVTLVTEVSGLAKPAPIEGTDLGIVLHGEGGTLHWKTQAAEAIVRDPAGAVVRTIAAPPRDHVADHFANFLAAVRSRDGGPLAADIDEGRQSTALCHLGNISYRLGTDLPFAEVEAAISSRRIADDPRALVARTRAALEANGCLPDNQAIRCGTWVETVPAAGRGTEETAVARDPRAAALERLSYRDPFVLPSEKAS